MAQLKTTTVNGDLHVTSKSNIKIGGGELFNLIYPIGSIYISANSTDPAHLFGGTWSRFAQGKTLISCDDTTYKQGDTGGNASVTLVEANLPSHSHTIEAHSHTIPSLTVNEHTHELEHTHSVTAEGTIPELIAATGGTAPSLTTSKSSTAGGGSHTHNIVGEKNGAVKVGREIQTDTGDNVESTWVSDLVSVVGDHVHSIPELKGTVDLHTHVMTHEHTFNGIKVTSESNTEKTTTSVESTTVASNTGSQDLTTNTTGLATAISLLQPYIAVYMWIRTA